ncbi:MAG: metallophosphoesterase [Thermoplasmatota archaeon]
MNPASIQPIPSEPALFIKEKKILVLADLHIGIERELYQSGLHVCSQTFFMMNRVLHLIKRYIPEKIILLGDVKHNIPSSTIQERGDVKRFVESILNIGEIHIIPGNHDGGIQKIVPSEIIIHPSDGCVIDEIAFVHGHRWPKEEIMQCNTVIIAHNHPRILLTDRLGYRSYESCWLRGKGDSSLSQRYHSLLKTTIIVMPAFNPLCGGIAINTDSMIGPFQKIIDINKTSVYLLDGSYLGKVKDIH